MARFRSPWPRVDGDPVAFGGIWEDLPDGGTLRTFATTPRMRTGSFPRYRTGCLSLSNRKTDRSGWTRSREIPPPPALVRGISRSGGGREASPFLFLSEHRPGRSGVLSARPALVGSARSICWHCADRVDTVR